MEASCDKIASLLRSMGLVNIPPDEYPILLEVMDKNKDGSICFNDFVSQIPTFDCTKVFEENEAPPLKIDSIKTKGKKAKFNFGGKETTQDKKGNDRFKYDKQAASQHSVVILNEEDYGKIIEDYKEKMSM
mmetsp:Transcript_20425/g.22798  ORF Transcript_20425/g.22798 Transcript_20425/m.22798 type:complete len:131 (-) Transcript_20425:34-426(-)